MTLQQKLKQISTTFGALLPNTYHYWRPKMQPPFIVWQEDGEGDSLHTGNKKAEQSITGTLDYYTKQEFDPMVDSIQQTFQSLPCGWYLNQVAYEDATNLIHYEWVWEVAGIG